MIKEEAYNMMSRGYPVTHKLFGRDEYLYMDKSFIIRNEDGMEFENDWDVRTSPEWLVDWYVYKNKLDKETKRSITKRVSKEEYNRDTIGMNNSNLDLLEYSVNEIEADETEIDVDIDYQHLLEYVSETKKEVEKDIEFWTRIFNLSIKFVLLGICFSILVIMVITIIKFL